jgi:hypothetical protein
MEGAKTKPLKPKKVTLMLHGKKIIKHKVGLLNLAEELGNVSQAWVYVRVAPLKIVQTISG